MRWRRLFNIVVPVVPRKIRGDTKSIGAEPEGAKGVFFSPQTLITFPVATFAIGLIWKVIETLLPQLKDLLWIPFILSLLMGAFIFWVGVTDPHSQLTKRETYIAAVVAFVNSVYLFASTTGIVTAVTSRGGS